MKPSVPEEDRIYIVHWQQGDKSANRSWADYRSACRFVRSLPPTNGSVSYYDGTRQSFINPMYELYSFTTYEVQS